jgi:hypothetical protein
MRTHWEPPKKIQQGVYHQMDLSGLGIDIKLKEKKRKDLTSSFFILVEKYSKLDVVQILKK